MHPRPRRGLLSRPAVEEIRRYRAHVDEQVVALIHDVPESLFSDLAFRIDLGINHEQQHQELHSMDIKHNLPSTMKRRVIASCWANTGWRHAW